MKKTLIASAIAVTLCTDITHANISVTSMSFISNYAATGSINDDGTMGAFSAVDPFKGILWTATQETTVITNSNGVAWTGSNMLGSWDYAADITNMTNDQVAIGAFFNWNGTNDIALLAVFDCVTNSGVCTGQILGTNGNKFGGMQTNPFSGQVPAFSGIGNLSAVPAPAAIWLLGSGLIGLAGVARRRKMT